MSKSDMVYRYTASKIEYLHSIADTGRGKGYLAELRHGIGKKPGELPSLWWLIFDRIDEEVCVKCRMGSLYGSDVVRFASAG